MNLESRPVWAEIHLDRIAHNVKEIRRRIGPRPQIMAVVKADAYGHGAVEVAQIALTSGCSRLAVALVEEGVLLRRAGLSVPIQALGGFCRKQIKAALDWNIILTVGTKKMLEGVIDVARSLGKKGTVHIKIDTGMGRYGELLEEGIELAYLAHGSPFLSLEGLMTHMATADERDKGFTDLQMERFLKAAAELARRGVEIPIKHVANSATIIDMPDKALDMVRPGIMLYGLWPSKEVNRTVMELRPALEWKAQIVQIKDMPVNTGISYGRTFITAKDMRVALLPLGYADGFNRLLSNRGEVLIHGEKAPILGRICMDQTMVDVTDIPQARVGDEVVLIGSQGKNFIGADDMADLLDTINYEVVCALSKRVPRHYLRND